MTEVADLYIIRARGEGDSVRDGASDNLLSGTPLFVRGEHAAKAVGAMVIAGSHKKGYAAVPVHAVLATADVEIPNQASGNPPGDAMSAYDWELVKKLWAA